MVAGGERSVTSEQRNTRTYPGGITDDLVKKLRIEIDSCEFEHPLQLLSKATFSMVRGLVRDVIRNGRTSCWTRGECRISLLPLKRRESDYLMHPPTGRFLELSHEIGQAVSCLHADQ